MNVRLLRMPEGLDPDDYLRQNGAEAFQKFIDSAKDFFDYKLEIALGRYQPDNPLGLVKITNDFIETLSKIENPILLTHYLKRLAQSLRLDENSIRTELLKLKNKSAERGTKARASAVVDFQKASIKKFKDEIFLLGLMIENDEICTTAIGRLEDDDFESQTIRRLFQTAKELKKQGQTIQWARFLNTCQNEDLKSELVQVSSMEWTGEDQKRAFADCFAQLKRKKLEKRLEDLRQSIAKAEREGNQEQVGVYIKEYQSLLQQVKV